MARRATALSRGPQGSADSSVGHEGLGFRVARTTVTAGAHHGARRGPILAGALPELQDDVPVPRGTPRRGRGLVVVSSISGTPRWFARLKKHTLTWCWIPFVCCRMRAWPTGPRMVFGACHSVTAATREHSPRRGFGRSSKGGQALKRACVCSGRGMAGSLCCICLSHPPIGVRYL